MYKLLFAVCVAVIAMVVAWMGLQPLEKVALSLKLEERRDYKIWIGAERELVPPTNENKSKWDEIKKDDFRVNPDPADTMHPGRYHRFHSGMSKKGVNSFTGAYSPNVDTTDILAVKQHYLRQLYSVAAENISSMLVPLYVSSDMQVLKIAASLVAEPFFPPGGGIKDRAGDPIPIPKHEWVSMRGLMAGKQVNYLDRVVDRMAALYPNKPVAAGASWNITFDSLAGYPVKQSIAMKVRERKPGRVILGYNAKAGTDGYPLLIDTCGVFMSIEFSATLSGLLEVDEASGLVNDGELEQRVEGVFRVDSLPGMESPEPVPFAITGQFKLQLKESLIQQEEKIRRVPVRGLDSFDIKPVKIDSTLLELEN